jgi:hypothetical protein
LNPFFRIAFSCGFGFTFALGHGVPRM